MRRALGELDQNTPVALRRSPRACVARVGAETPSRARVETVESVEPQTTTRQHNAAALDAAVALLRERNVESPRPSDPGHLKYKDALTKAGYRGDNGVVVLSKRLGAEKRRVDADSAANVLVDMSQLSVIEGEVVERGEEVIEERPEQPIPGRKGRSGRPQMTDEERELAVDEAEKAEEAKEQLLRSISREPSVQPRNFNDATLMAKHLMPRISAKAQKSLRSAIDGLDDVKTLAEQFDALVGDGKFSDPTEREFVENLIASHTRSRDAIDDWLTTNPRVPRAADLWDLPGGLCGAAALTKLRTARVSAEARPQVRPQQQNDGRRGPRGPRGGNLDETRDEGEAVVNALLGKPPGERDWRAVPKADLEKLYVFVMGEWYPAQQSHAWFVEALEDQIAEQYPDLLPQDASESDRLPGSPMSPIIDAVGDVSFADANVEDSPAANADVSMNDRSMDDVIV